MNISLTPELEALVNEKVGSGMYHSASEVIREGLRLLIEQDALRGMRLEALRMDIQRGVDQMARGEYTRYTREAGMNLAEEVKAEGRKRAGGAAKKERSADA